jgi:hypothetical protein
MITARDIQKRLILDFYRRSFVLANYTPRNWWECDVFEVTEAGYFREYEIKLSKADFKADALKEKERGSSWDPNRPPPERKHDLLTKKDVRGPSEFWFVCPRGIIEPSDLPSWAGLIHVWEIPNYKSPWNVRYERVVRAPKLHRQKYSEELMKHANSVTYYRMHGYFLDQKISDAEVAA